MGKMFNPKTVTIDPTPTQGSSNAVASGGVYDELEKISDVTIAQLIHAFGYYQYVNQGVEQASVDEAEQAAQSEPETADNLAVSE